MRLCGLAIAVKNSRQEVLRESHYVTPNEGGKGAVRDAIEYVCANRVRCESVIDDYIRSRRQDPATRPAGIAAEAAQKNPLRSQGRIAHRRGSHVYHDHSQGCYFPKHPAIGKFRAVGKTIGIRQAAGREGVRATSERPITVPSLRDSLIFPTSPGLTPLGLIYNFALPGSLFARVLPPAQNEYSPPNPPP